MQFIKIITVFVFLEVLIVTANPQANARFLGGGGRLGKFFAPLKFRGIGAGLGGGVNGHAGTYTIHGAYGGVGGHGGVGLGGYGGGLQSLFG